LAAALEAVQKRASRPDSAKKKQELRPLMECFGATRNRPRIAKPLKEMVGTRRLELLTSTVSRSY
jgi:hypothetical protein